MAKTSIEWSGDDGVIAAMSAYEQKVYTAIRMVANYWAPVIETWMKENRPWVDRTGAARAGLQGLVVELSRDVVAIEAKHGVTYGVWLELMWGGKYSVIAPALESHYDHVMRMLREVFE